MFEIAGKSIAAGETYACPPPAIQPPPGRCGQPAPNAKFNALEHFATQLNTTSVPANNGINAKA
jgi:hypothetical protein